MHIAFGVCTFEQVDRHVMLLQPRMDERHRERRDVLRAGGVLERMVALIVFGTPPSPPFVPEFFAGWQTVTHSVEQTSADRMTSSGTNTFYNSAGQAYRSGCSTAVGERFE